MAADRWIQSRAGSAALTWADLADLVKLAQQALDVDADGKPGPMTIRALHDRMGKKQGETPIPKGRKQIARVYGDPSWVKLPRGRAVDLDDAWERANIRWFKLHTGKRVRLHRLVGDEFVHLFKEACEASGYTPKSVQTFVPRIIGGSDKNGKKGRLSTHALGIGVDFDPSSNAMGARNLVNPDQPTMLRQHPEFLEVFRRAGWTCGADWRIKDDMHIQRAGV